MKNIKIIIIAAVSLFIGFACEDDKEIVSYLPENATSSSIITPLNGSTYELLQANDTNYFETFSWTAAEFGVDLPRFYSLQLGTEGSNFANPVELIATNSLSYQMKIGAFNLLLNDLGIASGVPTLIDLRVRNTVANPAVDTLYSDKISITVSSYGYSKPNITAPEAGNYELVIDSLNEIPFETFVWNTVNYGSEYTSSYVIEFDTIGNQFADAVELYSGKLTSYTPTNYELNNLMIGRGFEAGSTSVLEFRVKSNTGGKGNIVSDTKVYTIKSYTAELVVPPLYLVGSATDAGWNNANGLEIKWDKVNNEYSLITNFKAGGMKILEVSGQWAPQWGDDGTNTGKLKYRPDEATQDPPEIKTPGTGSFKMKVDIVNLTYKFEAQ